ncbi:hypothetical protein [Jiangella gansuensis]|uniref:hypothetical protein n=1 Tax=Jiangella gansuensis TaxID=281473 RepID=UPI00047B6DB9|nr:hypothetical protein [Jiangella gansuensis]
MIVPILLVAMVAILLVHGYVLRKRTSYDEHALFFDVNGSHDQTFVGLLQDFAPSPRSRGFDTKHFTSIYWG